MKMVTFVDQLEVRSPGGSVTLFNWRQCRRSTY